MKRIFKRTGLITAAMALLFSAATIQQANAQNGYGYGGYNDDDYVSYNDGASYQDFYDDLAPYGQWINDPQYGYVWCPDVDNNFRPYYTSGRWVMTDYGNTWVSDYRWGWAAFHYGRWTYDNYYGWVWIPGSQWAPAWVSWRNGGGYYGWAPLGPGVNISVSLGNNWWGGDFWWTFVPQQYLFSNNFYNYYRGPRYNNTYIRNTTYIYNTNVSNHVTYYYGPRPSEFQRATNQRVNIYRLNNENRPGMTSVRNNQVSIYRPPVRNNTAMGGRRPAPANAIEAPRAIGRINNVAVNPQTGMPATRPAFNPREYRNNANGLQNRNDMQQGRQPRNGAPTQNMDNRPGNLQQRSNQRIDQQRMDQQRMDQQRAEQQQRMNQQRDQQRMDQQRMDQQRAAEQQRINQQRDQQRMDQQRAEQQQRMNQQRDQQRMDQQRMDQQRAAEQQRMNQQRMDQQRMDQQRAAEQQRMNQQRMDQQRMDQQRAAEQQQRMNQQRDQQRMDQPRPAPQEQPRGGFDRRR